MIGRATADRTRAREAYCLDLARELVATSSVPLMPTGGVTRQATSEDVVASGVAVVGLGTALAVTPAPGVPPAYALIAEQFARRGALRRYRSWLADRPTPTKENVR